MEPKCGCRFIILDFGHPMSIKTIKTVINSLENILSLALVFPRTPDSNIGILVLNSDFAIFHSESNLQKNFDLITKNLNTLLNQTYGRVSVQEYKSLLSKSIEKSLHQSQEKFKNKNSSDSQSNSLLIQIAVVTKKNASVIANILSDVIIKLKKTVTNITSVKTFKIVQILTEPQEKTRGTSDKNTLINWITYADNVFNLSGFFKEWLLNSKQQLRILLSKDLNLEVKCDVDDLVISSDFFYDMLLKGSKISSDIPRDNHNLEIINRLPLSGLCPTLVFGIPRRIYATSCNSNWTELQINKKIFKELCRELNQTGQGLLAKSVLPTEKSTEIINFYFLTSDGDMLLMNDVAPHELYIPKQAEDTVSAEFCEDESAASLVKSCLEKIKFLSEYRPDNFTSGVYENLKDFLVKSAQNKGWFEYLDRNAKLLGKKSGKKNNSTSRFDQGNGMSNPERDEKKKRAKLDTNKELQNVHPALLAPNIVEKYRKVHSDAFNLPELGQDYNENMTQCFSRTNTKVT